MEQNQQQTELNRWSFATKDFKYGFILTYDYAVEQNDPEDIDNITSTLTCTIYITITRHGTEDDQFMRKIIKPVNLGLLISDDIRNNISLPLELETKNTMLEIDNLIIPFAYLNTIRVYDCEYDAYEDFTIQHYLGTDPVTHETFLDSFEILQNDEKGIVVSIGYNEHYPNKQPQ